MAYKFQMGKAFMSGNLIQSGTMTAESNAKFGGTLGVTGAATVNGLASLDGGINVDDNFTVSAAGAVVAVGVNAGGALSGVTTLAASGLLSVASISMDDGSTLGPDSVSDLWTFNADGDTTQKDGAYDFDIASHDGTNGLKLGGTLVNASAADLNFTNVASAGTAEASKAVVLDASKNISTLGTVGCGAITSTGASVMGSLNIGGTLACDTSFTLDSVSVDATELGFIDGVAAGTAAASKALVLDGSKDIGTLGVVTLASLTGSKGRFDVANGNLIVSGTVAATGIMSGAACTFTTLAGTSLALQDGNITNVGQMDCDTVAADDPAVGLNISFGGNTGLNKLSISDDLGSALDITQAANSYLKFATTNGSELITVGENSTFVDTTIENLGSVTTADINGGTIDGVAIGNSAAGAGTFTTLACNAGAFAIAGLDIDGATDIGEAIVDADLFIIDNGAGGLNRKCTASRLKTYIQSGAGDSISVSGSGDHDVTLQAGVCTMLSASAASRTWTLPASPTVGDIIVAKANTLAVGTHLRVTASGDQFIDNETYVDIESAYGAVQFVYVASNKWTIY